MRLFSFVLITIMLPLFSCAEREKLPNENNGDNGAIENNPVVTNQQNYFEFQIDAQSFFFISQYPVDFNTDTIKLEILVSNYTSGSGNVTLENESGTQAYFQTLTGDRNLSENLNGTIAPVSIRLDFTNYQADVSVILSLN